MQFDCRLADPEDMASILDLQDKNLVTKIEPSEMIHGFVTTPFSPEQLEALRLIEGLFVAMRENVLVGHWFDPSTAHQAKKTETRTAHGFAGFFGYQALN